MARTTSRDR